MSATPEPAQSGSEVVGSYSRPVRQMREVRALLIQRPARVGEAINALEAAIVDLGGQKEWGKPDA